MEGDESLPTSVTVTRGVLADLNLIKAQMSKAENRTVHLPEVIQRLMDYWHQGQGKNGTEGSDGR